MEEFCKVIIAMKYRSLSKKNPVKCRRNSGSLEQLDYSTTFFKRE